MGWWWVGGWVGTCLIADCGHVFTDRKMRVKKNNYWCVAVFKVSNKISNYLALTIISVDTPHNTTRQPFIFIHFFSFFQFFYPPSQNNLIKRFQSSPTKTKDHTNNGQLIV